MPYTGPMPCARLCRPFKAWLRMFFTGVLSSYGYNKNIIKDNLREVDQLMPGEEPEFLPF